MDEPLQQEKNRWYPLIEHPVQRALVNAVPEGLRFPVVPAGRRCLEAGTLVATPHGPVPIEQLKAGDPVIGFNEGGQVEVTTVARLFENGPQEVMPLRSSDKKYLAGTRNHRLWAISESSLDKRRPHLHGDYQRVPIEALGKRYRVRRVYCPELIGGTGTKPFPLAYVLAVLLADGCGRDHKASTGNIQRTLKISGEDYRVFDKVAGLLGCTYRRAHQNNHTHVFDVGQGAIDRVPFYKQWVSGRYSHEKIADPAEVATWDKSSALDFLAGIIDTDGSIYYKTPAKVEATIRISMQARSVVQACSDIVFLYFQECLMWSEDRRAKYVNGPVCEARTTTNLLTRRIIAALKDRSVRCAAFDDSTLQCRNILGDRIGLRHGEPYQAETFDIQVSNATNLYLLHHGGIVTSNSGKTERFKRFLALQAMKNRDEKYFAAAPTFNQAKKIFWDDLKLLTLSSLHLRRPSESELKIYIPNGTEIHVLGLDKPQRIEGINWTGGGIDEIADTKPESLHVNIMPALNTVDPRRPNYRAWCWFLGVPDGLNHYYDLAQAAQLDSNPEYGYYHWKSAEILPADVIESAKRTMSKKQFTQEFEASFETATGRIYEDYSTSGNSTSERIQPHEALHWSHDQNFTPLSSCISVVRGNTILLLDEIVLTSAVSRQSANEFVERYAQHQNKTLYLYGDPAGRAGEKHGHASDYTEIEQVLKAAGWQVKRRVEKKAPAIKDRQNAVRAKVLNAAGDRTLLVNPETAPWCHKGLSTVQLQEGSTFQEDQKNPYQHITTAIGYMISVLWPVDHSVIVPEVVPGGFG